LLPELVVSGDRQRLGQILLNVAENAVESTPEGGSISFEVSCLEDDEAEATFSFTFADDGSGISPERMECLFKAFEHMEEASCLWQCGGLGLAISSALVNEMGGKISVSSAPGEGSVFSFILSFVKSELLSGGGFAPGKLSGKNILLAEDIAINRLALRELLTGTGAVLDEAEDGLEAVSMFEHSTLSYYDIIFMDLLMPRLGGVEAAKAIRALERSDAQSVPIIALSANGADRDGEHLRRSGINEQTSKPLDLATIAKLLRKYAK
jgi:CheY-like chemotaxis protein